MNAFLYTRPSDNLLSTATIAVNTGTEDPDYLSANLIDGQPEKPGKLTTTSGAWVTTLASSSRADLAMLVHPNLDAGLEVRLQAYTSDSWGGPLLNVTFTIPARYANRYPVNPWLDLAALFPNAADRTFKYWRWYVVGVNSAPVSIGELWLSGARRTFGVRNISRGSRRQLQQPAIVHRTELLKKHKYPFGQSLRTVSIDVEATDTVRDEVDAWHRDAEYVNKPFMAVPSSEEPDGWLVDFADTDHSYVRGTPNYNPLSVTLEEAARGLYP